MYILLTVVLILFDINKKSVKLSEKKYAGQQKYYPAYNKNQNL